MSGPEQGGPRSGAWLDLQSALNGWYGHWFEDKGTALALPMSLLCDDPLRAGSARLLVFVHGLCMNESGWRGPEHARFRAWARRKLRARVAYLRYNTGLRISTNGARLATLLERVADARELILVGHSMGGLVARSALHQAQEAGYAWPRRVSRLACLGSPHEGVGIERHLDRLFGPTPWSRAIMRLGDVRSEGLRDLRFGHLVESDWRECAPEDPRGAYSRVGLSDHVEHLHVAASRRGPKGRRTPGDGLVSVESALARNLHPAEGVRRELFRNMGHFGLLQDGRIYELLRAWIGSS